MATEANKVIYSMVKVSKYYNKKPVLENISLSYFYGAKIGVLGLNGSGKSSLLRILAGVDKDFNGEVHPSPGYTIGLLEQEPRLDENKSFLNKLEEDLENEHRYNGTLAAHPESLSEEELEEILAEATGSASP